MKNINVPLSFVTCMLAAFTGWTWAQDSGNTPLLKILPAQNTQVKSVGKNVLLTCQAAVEDAKLITDLQWVDPNGRVILRANTNNGSPAARMWIETMAGDVLALIIPTLELTDEGNYTCTATYANDAKLSNSVQIKTIMEITWVDAPLEQYPTLHSDCKIRCKVRGTPAPKVNWHRNKEPIESSGRYVVDIDDLLIKNVTEADDGVYTCRAAVFETGELAERNIRVEVHTPPAFEDMPGHIKVIEGDQASIKCKAIGKPKPTFSWIKSSTQQNLSSADRFSVNEHTGVLTISRVDKDDNGEYKCIAKNAASTVSKSVHLDVLIKPKFVSYKNLTVATGKEAVMECRASGNPLPEITFRKLSQSSQYKIGGQPDDDRITVENIENKEKGDTVGKLTIRSLTRGDDGLYACIATNTGGEASKNGHLTVEFKPSFGNTPHNDAWSWNNNRVNLTCLAESIPNATIIWKLSGRDIEDDVNVKKHGNGPQSTLTVTPINTIYYGPFMCEARNTHGTASVIINLKEARPPSGIMQAKLDIITATTITFRFVGPKENGGLPIKAYAVQFREEKQDWNEARNRTWAYDSTYILDGLEPQTTYNFRFAAMNDAGRGDWEANERCTMRKRSSPEEPHFLNSATEGVVTSPYSDNFELRWKIPADNGEPITRYEIKYCPVRSVNDKWTENGNSCESVLIDKQNTAYILKNLKADTHYRIELRAQNAIGDSIPGQVTVKTARGADSYVPPPSSTALSSGIIVSIVVAALFVIFIIVDVSCYCFNKAGLLMTICEKTRGSKTSDEDAKLNRDEKEPLKDERKEPIIQGSLKRETSVDFDVKKSISKTSFVGKDSAV